MGIFIALITSLIFAFIVRKERTRTNKQPQPQVKCMKNVNPYISFVHSYQNFSPCAWNWNFQFGSWEKAIRKFMIRRTFQYCILEKVSVLKTYLQLLAAHRKVHVKRKVVVKAVRYLWQVDLITQL